MKKILGMISPLLFAIIFVAMGPMTAHAATVPNVWWPTQNVQLDGTQPLKAVIDGKNLSDYQMYWQVDNGGLVPMYDSSTDYPHKEAMVDLSGWNWSSTGTYSLTFIARDNSGNEIGRTNVVIRHSSPVTTSQPVASVPTTSTQTVTTTAPTQITQIQSAPTSLTNPTAPVATTVTSTNTQVATVTPTVTTASTPTTTTTTETARLAIRVWWPTVGANLTGVQKVQAVLGSTLSAYTMYWSVDGANQNLMSDSYTVAPHKEAIIDFTNWHWKGNNQYVLNFIAKDLQGNVIATANVPVYVNATQTQTAVTPVTTSTQVATATAPSTTQTTQTVTQTTPVSTQTVAPLTTTQSSSKLYVDPTNPATAQAVAWAVSRPNDSAIMAKMGAQSTGIWLGGWNANVQGDVATAMSKAAAQNTIPTFVAYNIPGRDCGSYSAGGASDASSYLTWIKQVSAGLGSGQAILVLEPDGLASIDCLSQSQQADRYSMLSQALDIFRANNTGTRVYVDAGHSGWIDPTTMANRLKQAGIAKAKGFSLNVSNFVTTSDNTTYGTNVVNALQNIGISGSHFVIDTSRNGSGSNGEWCNPTGRSLGQEPTLSTGNPLVDAFLWIKRPGESDGTCNGGPSAGTWWPDYALDLAKRAGY